MSDGNKDFVLLGIKYESAKIAGVGGEALENIVGQLREEVGEEWETNPIVERGRNAVRQEHDLNETGSPESGPEPASSRRSRWRLFGRRS